jgi:REP element-mobilizing transposase RayT
MTYPRYQLVDPHKPGFYHLMSRCVRRAFLCGRDPITGRNYEHRKDWIERQIHQLARSFTVDVYSYAVMSNHYHLVVCFDPTRAAGLDDRTVADRWLNRFGDLPASQLELRRKLLCADPERIADLRQRLGDLSWFMRCLNEPIARRANREDGCTGRFWEGRFQSKALLDRRAVLTAMVYADLNPIRAGITQQLDASHHTSIYWRLCHRRVLPHAPLMPVAGAGPPTSLVSCSNAAYLELLDWSGRQARPGKRGRIPGELPTVLAMLNAEPESWLADVQALERRFWRAVGSIDALGAVAARIGQRWLKGVRNGWRSAGDLSAHPVGNAAGRA